MFLLNVYAFQNVQPCIIDLTKKKFVTNECLVYLQEDYIYQADWKEKIIWNCEQRDLKTWRSVN
jgi:hypothetical protein